MGVANSTNVAMSWSFLSKYRKRFFFNRVVYLELSEPFSDASGQSDDVNSEVALFQMFCNRRSHFCGRIFEVTRVNLAVKVD
jgi:hypothetical protein